MRSLRGVSPRITIVINCTYLGSEGGSWRSHHKKRGEHVSLAAVSRKASSEARQEIRREAELKLQEANLDSELKEELPD